MKINVRNLLLVLIWFLIQQFTGVAVAQDHAVILRTSGPVGTKVTAQPEVADGNKSPALTGGHRPLYRLRRSDVLTIEFTFAPEFNQTVSVQPDGFIPLKGTNELYATGLTVDELREQVRKAYAGTLHDPEVTIVLKDFDKPYFVAAGEVRRPGKYELRADMTVTQAVAVAGGFSRQAKYSQVVLFRRVSDEWSEARIVNVKAMLRARNLREDLHVQPGDLIYVPQTLISKIERLIPTSNLSLYANPAQF